MKYAFDWGDTLNVNPELQEVARVLVEEGHAEVLALKVLYKDH